MMVPAVLLTLAMTGPTDVPDAIIAAVALRETGSTWHGVLVQAGPRLVGKDGEVSPWQLSPAVLRDLKVSVARVRHSPRYAELVCRRWLAHLFLVCGSWPRALAAYHRGTHGTNRADAMQYAQDCLNLANVYRP
jgi:hypothetical protein